MNNNFYFLNNNLYSEKFLQKEIKKIVRFNEDISGQFNEIKKLSSSNNNMLNEAQLEDEFIKPVLKILGWSFLHSHILSTQGKKLEPDFLLFKDKKSKQNFIDIKQCNYNEKIRAEICVICENKAFGESLDNNKTDASNPHFQLINYLMYLRKDYGFLTNGKLWRFYDNRKISSNKVFYEIDLEKIIDNKDVEAFKYFYHIFKKDNFVAKPVAHKIIPAEEIYKKSEEVKIEIEENLKNVIYGYSGHDSIFEIAGKEIHKKYPQENLTAIYENTLYFIFRLLFIFYFEDKYAAVLQKHKHYDKELSLNVLHKQLKSRQKQKNQNENIFTGYRQLRKIFKTLDEGDEAIQIPVFNGGLFAKDRAEFLDNQTLMPDEVLFKVLDNILFYQKDGESLFRRDFKTLSVIQLGSIYEGLLEFCFEKASETTHYIEYKSAGINKKSESSYVDAYDYQKIKSNKKNTLLYEKSFNKGEIYLKSSNNSRKQSASYYTPSSLSSFMAKSAIDEQLKNNPNILSLKIIDNACGSGHFLVECLNYTVFKALNNRNQDGELADKKLLREIDKETEKIKEAMLGFEEKDKQIDHTAVLKRILLKKIIYGLDFNPFAVELTKLSLWIDTFIFGTPLSLLKHHIKTGNSLIGARLSELDLDANRDLFQHKVIDSANKLREELAKLTKLSDTTAQEIKKSKEIYEEKIKPLQKKLNSVLNYLSYIKIKKIEGAQITPDISLLNDLWVDAENKLADEIGAYNKKYKFFNYEVEFPEVYAETQKGFNIIIGNPPWDKTKLDDKDFFSQYEKDYRTMPNSKKKTVKKDLLDKIHIKQKYEGEREFIENYNEYCKANFPHNKGAGDGNLFRFFVENNLKQLAADGNLTYIIPSALMFEEGSQNLRKYIFENFKVKFFYSFENRNKLFPSIDSRYKFALIQIINKYALKQRFDAKFMILRTDNLENKQESIKYTSEIINATSPIHRALFELKNDRDLPILKKAYKKFPVFSTDYLDFTNELHMTADKDLFLEQPSSTVLPLYEGKMIHQFNSQFSRAKYYLNPENFDKRIEKREIKRFLTSLSLSSEETAAVHAQRHIKFDREFYRLAFRAVARDTDERTLIFSMLPKNCGTGNSLWASIPKKYLFENNEIKIKELLLRSLFLMSLFNTLTVDFIAREMIQINVNKTYILRLPLPQPQDAELLNNKIYKHLIKNALTLTLKNDWENFKDLARDLNIKKEETELTEKQTDLLKIENDSTVAALYCITKQELKHICSTFKVLNNKNPSYCKTLLECFSSRTATQSQDNLDKTR